MTRPRQDKTQKRWKQQGAKVSSARRGGRLLPAYVPARKKQQNNG